MEPASLSGYDPDVQSSRFKLVTAAIGLIATAAATGPVAQPDVQSVRDQLAAYTEAFPRQSAAEIRRAYDAPTAAVATFADRFVPGVWRSEQAMRAVRDRWGEAAERQLGHLIGMDTVADDRTATVQVDHDQARVTYADPYLGPDYLIRVHGRWLFDGSRYLASMSPEAMAALAAPPTDRLDALAVDVRRGRFPTVGDAMDAFRSITAVAALHSPSTQPAASTEPRP